MIKEAVQYIIGLAPIEIHKEHGQVFSSRSLHEVRPQKPNMQSSFKIFTLSGIADWLLSEDGKEARENCVVHIEDFDKVSVFSSPDPEYRNRHRYLTSESHTNQFSFGQYMPIENFVIETSSKFVMTDELARTIKTVSSIKSENVLTVEDDGISQAVTASSKLNRIEQVKMSPFVNLKPFRTFREIEQPESRFLLRMKQRESQLPTVALFEADNAEWKLKAMKDIEKFIMASLAENGENQPGINIVM